MAAGLTITSGVLRKSFSGKLDMWTDEKSRKDKSGKRWNFSYCIQVTRHRIEHQPGIFGTTARQIVGGSVSVRINNTLLSYQGGHKELVADPSIVRSIRGVGLPASAPLFWIPDISRGKFKLRHYPLIERELV